jgi:hypothetical protein
MSKIKIKSRISYEQPSPPRLGPNLSLALALNHLPNLNLNLTLALTPVCDPRRE